MLRPVEVRSLKPFQIWLRFADGVEGEVDLSHLAGRGVFKAWREPGVFDTVRLGSSGEIEWPDVEDLCPDSLYLRVTGFEPEEVFPNLKAIQLSV